MSPGPIVDPEVDVSIEEGSTSQTLNTETLASEEQVTLNRKRDPAPDPWAAGYGSIHRSPKTQARDFEIGKLLTLTPLIGAVPRCLTIGDEHALWEDSDDPGRRHFKTRPS